MSTEPSLRHVRVPRWKIERVLADQLADPFLEHDTAIVAIAAAFSTSACAECLWDWLDDAARPLFNVSGGLRERAVALTELMTNQLRLTICTDRHEAMLLDHLLAIRAGHPLLLATVGRELARRAGWPGLVATSLSEPVTVLTDEEYFAPIAYGTPIAAGDAARLRPCRSHTIAAATLATIAHRAPPELAASAIRVGDALPATPHQHE